MQLPFSRGPFPSHPRAVPGKSPLDPALPQAQMDVEVSILEQAVQSPRSESTRRGTQPLKAPSSPTAYQIIESELD